ncbi:MAG TPA: hypothetical protein VLX92_16655 [Kofleriaceae bacterium]|nr:hypothetical protein [Kofleriaceae bacterium]
MTRALVVALVAGLCAVAYAEPALAPHTAKTFTVSLPKGWNVVDQDNVVAAQQDPRRQDAAVVMCAVQASGVDKSEEELLTLFAQKIATNLEVRETAPVPGGKGHALLADGTVGGIAVRVGAIALVDHGAGAVCALAAKADDFDGLGGARLALDVLASVHVTQPPAQTGNDFMSEMTRMSKRTGAAELPGDRAAFDRTALLHAKGWYRGTADGLYVTDPISTTMAKERWSHMEESEGYTFFKDGTYRLLTLNNYAVTNCPSSFVTVETGTYTFDGRALVITAKNAVSTMETCTIKKHSEAVKPMPPPRHYDVALGGDGWVTMIGPSCTAISWGQKTCLARARWDMKPQ